MKTTIKPIVLLLCLFCFTINAQDLNKRQSLTLLNLDSKISSVDALSLDHFVRTELEKLDMFAVTDRYDILYQLEKHSLRIDSCCGQTCLAEAGAIIGSDKMLSGTVEQAGKQILVTFRLIDVKEKKVEKKYVHEFLNLHGEIQDIVKLSVAGMFNCPYDKNLMMKLSKSNDPDNSTNNPQPNILKLVDPWPFGVSFGFNAINK